MEISVSVTRRWAKAHVEVTGELDSYTVLQLRPRLDDALARGCTCFTIDAGGLTFVSAAGLAAFVHLQNEVTRRGGTTTFVAASPAFRRVCKMAGLTRAFGLARSMPAVHEMA